MPILHGNSGHGGEDGRDDLRVVDALGRDSEEGAIGAVSPHDDFHDVVAEDSADAVATGDGCGYQTTNHRAKLDSPRDGGLDT